MTRSTRRGMRRGTRARTISESLIGKQRRKAGLAGTSGTEGEAPAGRKAGGAKGKVRSSSKEGRGRPSAESAGPGQPQEGRRVAEGGPTPAATAGTDGPGERE